MSGGRTNRRWPDDLRDQLFIKRPHALEQLRERAGLPRSYNLDRCEEDLRSAVCEQMMAGKILKSRSFKDSEFVVRVALPNAEVVYALVETGADGGKYKFLLHTVYTQEMYQQWNEEGKLGALGDLPAAEALKKVDPVPKKEEVPDHQKFMVLWKGKNGQVVGTKMVPEHLVGGEILILLQQGYSPDRIEVYKKYKFDLSVRLGD